MRERKRSRSCRCKAIAWSSFPPPQARSFGPRRSRPTRSGAVRASRNHATVRSPRRGFRPSEERRESRCGVCAASVGPSRGTPAGARRLRRRGRTRSPSRACRTRGTECDRRADSGRVAGNARRALRVLYAVRASRRSRKASGCRRWKRWRAAPPSSGPTRRAFRRSLDEAMRSSTRRTSTRSPPGFMPC